MTARDPALRRLVVNADDLGLTVGVNDGIFDAHDHGILTSASLFASAPATEDAIRRSSDRPSLGVGCHLALVDGRPTLPPERVPTLVGDDGRFRPSWKPLLAACLRGRVSLVEVERELTAQVDRLRSEGVSLTHLDAHKHVHAFPPIFDIVVRIGARFGIAVVRVPYERVVGPVARRSGLQAAVRRDGASGRGIVWKQALLNLALWPWARRDRQVAATHGIATPNLVGRIHTGALTLTALAQIFRFLDPGVTELMVHPGYVDDALAQSSTRLLDSRVREVELLCSPEMRALVDAERLELVRHDMNPSRSSAFSAQRSLRHAS
jgi:predicted glycoside hydrolase/deacetylase ChbG (UPF0249 family)